MAKIKYTTESRLSTTQIVILIPSNVHSTILKTFYDVLRVRNTTIAINLMSRASDKSKVCTHYTKYDL